MSEYNHVCRSALNYIRTFWKFKWPHSCNSGIFRQIGQNFVHGHFPRTTVQRYMCSFSYKGFEMKSGIVLDCFMFGIVTDFSREKDIILEYFCY